jgi:hypothetical protein
MKTVNAIMLKEEMDRKKAAKLSMTRQEKVDYVNNWKKENDTFLCEAFGLMNCVTVPTGWGPLRRVV